MKKKLLKVALLGVAIVFLLGVANLTPALAYHGNGWHTMADVPEYVDEGGALVYTGGDYIYAFPGDWESYFLRYSISTDSWDDMADAPADVYDGGALVWTGGDYIYAFTGDGEPYFFRYSISDDSWEDMADALEDVEEGGSLVYTGGDYIYALTGDWEPYFLRYSISDDDWDYMDEVPEDVEEGGALVWTGGDYIYAFTGDGEPYFFRYSISDDSWIYMADAPEEVEEGGSLVYTGGDYIYAFPGDWEYYFLRYSISNNDWDYMEGALGDVDDGGSLVYTGANDIYAFRGDDNTDFWRYQIGPNAPDISSPSHPDQSVSYPDNDPVLEWTEPEDTSGIEGYSYKLNDQPVTIPDDTIDTSDLTVSYTDLADGTWYFHIKALSNVGHSGLTGHFKLNIAAAPPAPPAPAPPAPAAAAGGPAGDTSPPTVWFASPGAGWSLTSTIGVIVGAADNVSVSRVDFYIDGASVSSDDTAPYTYDWDTTTVADGSHTISAAAYDAAGNVGTAAIPVTVANAVPTVVAAAPIVQAAPRTMFQVHAGAFRSLRAARARVARLARRGFSATIITQGGSRPYLIEIGLFEDLGGARALLRRLFARRIRFARILQVLR